MIERLISLSSYCGPALYDAETGRPISLEHLAETFPRSLAELELSDRAAYEIPTPVLDAYRGFRPTPLFRARALEAELGTTCELYFKDEGATSTGNHKATSALLLAYLCARDGIRTLTTETTGNWGQALALAGRHFGLEVLCFIDSVSDRERPEKSVQMRKEGASVVVVEPDDRHSDLLSLSADAAISYTRELADAAYIFGSVYNYFIVPQTVIGLEARAQLGGRLPDIVVGSCGGGANLLGTAAAFLVDRLEGGARVEVVCAEAESCPILSRGSRGFYSIDSQGYYPLLSTYGLDGLRRGDYIGGLGSTIVAAAAAHFHACGWIHTRTYSPQCARAAAELFEETERRSVALETGYQLAAVIEIARARNGVRILSNLSSG